MVGNGHEWGGQLRGRPRGTTATVTSGGESGGGLAGCGVLGDPGVTARTWTLHVRGRYTQQARDVTIAHTLGASLGRSPGVCAL